MTPYLSDGTNRQYETIMRKARRTNDKRDRDDREFGYAAPGDAGLQLHVRTVMTALYAGIAERNWDAVAEGQAMLEKIELVLRKRDRLE